MDTFSHSQVCLEDMWRLPFLARKQQDHDIEWVDLITGDKCTIHYDTYQNPNYKGIGFPINYNIKYRDLSVRLILPDPVNEFKVV